MSIYGGTQEQIAKKTIEEAKRKEQEQAQMQSAYSFTANKNFRKEFMDYYEKLLADNTDPSVRKRLLENPYLNVSLRDKNGWDGFTELFGFGSKWNNELAAAEQQAKNYATQIIEQNRVQDLESPVSQSQRQLDAGLNPDINGGIDSGRIPDFDDQATGLPDSIYGSYSQDSFADLGHVAMAGLQTIMSIVSGVQNLHANGVNIEAAELAVSDKYMDTAMRQVANDFGKMSDEDIISLAVSSVANRFGDSNNRLANIKTLDDLIKFVDDHNKEYGTHLTVDGLISDSFIKEVKKRDFSYIPNRRTRKHVERYYNAIDPQNPEVQAMVGDWVKRKSEGKKSEVELDVMLDKYGSGVFNLFNESEKMRLEADKEYYAYQKELYTEWQKERSFEGEDGTIISGDLASMQASAEFEAYAAEKLTAKRQELDSKIALSENELIENLYKSIDESDMSSFYKSLAKTGIMFVRGFLSRFGGSAASGLGNSVGKSLGITGKK